MSSFDYFAVLLYMLGVFAISFVSARRVSDHKDMFSAGRQAPWWAAGLSGFMTMFSAGTFAVWGGIAYKFGIVAVMINTCYGIAALLAGYLVAGRWNALGVTTPAEYIRLRFGASGLHFYTWTMMLKRILGVSVSLYALAVILVALIPLEEGSPFRDATTGNLSLAWAVLMFGAVVVIYTMVGGLWAVLMTDVLQFIVLTLVVLLVAALMIGETGNLLEFAQTLPEGFFHPTSADYGWLFLAGWVTINFFMVGAEWAFVQRFLAVNSPADARKSAYLFGVMYLVTPIFWLFPPLLYRGVNPDANPEQAYILAAKSVLPVGVVGLMFAAMFSATASMVSSQLNVFAGVLTNDFYRPLVNPGASGRTLVFVGRFFTAVLGLALTLVAVLVPHLGGAEKLIITVNSLLVVPLLAPSLWGMFSRRIGIADMCFVALSSFLLGATLRFGLSIDSNNAEVLVGVILPLLMLCVIHRLRESNVDVGWNAVERQRLSAIEMLNGANTPRLPDPLITRMVVTCLVACAIGLFAFSLLANHDRTIIIVFGICIVLIARIVQFVSHNLANR